MYQVLHQLFIINPIFSADTLLIETTMQYYQSQRELSTEFERTVIESLLHIYNMQGFDVKCFNIGNANKLNRKWVYKIAIHILQSFATRHILFEELKKCTVQYLTISTMLEPVYPTDYVRYFPDVAKKNKLDELLKDFCENPNIYTLDYRKAEQERKEMQSRINHYHLDIITDTIKKGSPYTLRLTKNTNTYNRFMKEFEEDGKMLGKLEEL
jgi:hypothetical protein